MRGEDLQSEGFFSYLRLEQRIPADHPLRAIRELVDAALKEVSRDFNKLYARDGRPSIPPERLLRALLLQAFYTVRSERQLMEQLDYNLLFRWFVGLLIDPCPMSRSQIIAARRATSRKSKMSERLS
jgi:transposase